jgi:hypothetical protein
MTQYKNKTIKFNHRKILIHNIIPIKIHIEVDFGFPKLDIFYRDIAICQLWQTLYYLSKL